MWVDLGIFFKYLTLWKDALLRTAAEIEENRADRRSLANLLVSWPKLGNCEIDSTLFFILAQSKHSIKRPLGTCSQNYPDDERCDDKIISFLFFSQNQIITTIPQSDWKLFKQSHFSTFNTSVKSFIEMRHFWWFWKHCVIIWWDIQTVLLSSSLRPFKLQSFWSPWLAKSVLAWNVSLSV